MANGVRRAVQVTAAMLLAMSGMGQAQEAKRNFALPAGILEPVLDMFEAQSGLKTVIDPGLLRGRQTNVVSGSLTPRDALDALLAGSGLHADYEAGRFVIRAMEPPRSRKTAPVDDAITVTGTRIRGAAPVGSPVLVIDRKAIADSGRATISDFIQTIPQNFSGGQTQGTAAGNSMRNNAQKNTGFGDTFNLRGLGSTSTLTLFDGNRPALAGAFASFADVSLIPAVAIDRIEILTDGASSIYGSDAVAGVVNMRFRHRFDGVEAQLYDGTAAGDFGQEQGAILAGHRWKSGGVLVAYQYDHRGRLSGSDRAYATQDLSAYGGPDNRSTFTLPATIIAADGSVYSAARLGTAQDPVTAGDLFAGALHHRDEARETDLLPRQDSHSVYAAADQQLGFGGSLFARLLWAQRRFDSAVLPVDSSVTVPSTNPYYVDPLGTGEPIEVERDFTADLGAAHNIGKVTALNATAGVEGDVGRWHYEVSGGYGRQREYSAQVNLQNSARLAAAAATDDPATAFNPFGPNSPTLDDTIRGSIAEWSRYTVWTSAARFDGPLVALPAGPLKLALGAEYRHERYRGTLLDDQGYDPALATQLDDPPQHRHITAEYAELAIPVLAGDRLPGRLDLSVSGRIEQYSDVGSTRNPKVGGRWEPVPGLALRASWGTSFRAPSLLETGNPANTVYYGAYLPDPNSPTGETAVVDISGYKPDIRPEKATTWTAGFDLKPVGVPGLSLSATYFHTDYRDRIESPANEIFTFLQQRSVFAGLIQDNPSAAEVAAYFADPHFVNLSGITPDEVKVITDARLQNLARNIISGIDANLAYTHPLGGGAIEASASATRLLTYEAKLTPGADAAKQLSTYGHPVKLRLRGSLGWHDARTTVSGAINYTGGYSNTLFLPAQPVASWTTVDLQIGRTIGAVAAHGQAYLGLSVTNLLDRNAPYIANVQVQSTVGYDAQAASAVGRLIALQGRFTW